MAAGRRWRLAYCLRRWWRLIPMNAPKFALCLIGLACLPGLHAAENHALPTPAPEVSFYGIPTPEVRFSVDHLCTEIGSKLGSVSIRGCQSQNLHDTGRFSVLGRPLAHKIYPPLDRFYGRGA